MNEKLKERIFKVADDCDQSKEDIMLVFSVIKDKIRELEPYLTEEKLEHRAFNGLEDYFSNMKFSHASEFSFIPFGISSEAKDTNKKMRDAILENFSKANKRIQMIRDGKIMVMKTSEDVIDDVDVMYEDVYKPVKTIKSMTQMDSGEWVVTEGQLWSPGDEPIARDYRTVIKYREEGEEYENRNWSRPLNPNWKLVLFGLGLYDGTKQVKNREGVSEKKKKTFTTDGLITKVDFYGNEANPTHPKFIPKSNPFFKQCKLKVTDKKWTNDLFISATARLGKSGNFDIDTVTKVKFGNWVDAEGNEHKGLIPIINNRVMRKAKYIEKKYNGTDLKELPKDKAKTLTDIYNLYKKFLTVDYIPFIDLSDVHNYHMTHRAKRDKEGEIVKDSTDTWDEIDFDSFALTECTLKGVYEKEGKPPKMILSDYSLGDDKSLFVKFINGLNTELRSASVYIALTTSRGNQAYDPEVEAFVEDPENAVAMPKVKGVGLIVDFRKMNIKQLIGDL